MYKYLSGLLNLMKESCDNSERQNTFIFPLTSNQSHPIVSKMRKMDKVQESSKQTKYCFIKYQCKQTILHMR